MPGIRNGQAVGVRGVLLGAASEEGADLLVDLVDDLGADLRGQLQLRGANSGSVSGIWTV
jgi:hypothetical protein